MRFTDIDLLWSEGVAYNMGFATALSAWAGAIREGGFAVVSELCWLKDDPPALARDFFEGGYPDMRTIPASVELAHASGFRCLESFALPDHAWVDGYYEVLEPRATALLDHAGEAVRDFAQDAIREIEVLRRSEGSYGYVFFVLQSS